MSHSTSITVLIVDDDSDLANLFAEYLGMFGVRVLGIGRNGKQAFELYQKLQPDVVFLDVMMPEFDGLYGLEQIKQFDSSAKVIMLTADVRQSTEERIRDLGANSIIYKPFEMNDLFLALNKLVSVQ